jgi:hypothetical protein
VTPSSPASEATVQEGNVGSPKYGIRPDVGEAGRHFRVASWIATDQESTRGMRQFPFLAYQNTKFNGKIIRNDAISTAKPSTPHRLYLGGSGLLDDPFR